MEKQSASGVSLFVSSLLSLSEDGDSRVTVKARIAQGEAAGQSLSCGVPTLR